MLKILILLSLLVLNSAYADVKYTVLSQDHPPYIDFSSPSTSMVHQFIQRVNQNLKGIKLIIVEIPYKRAILTALHNPGHFVITTNFNVDFHFSETIKIADAKLGLFRVDNTQEIRSIGIVRGEQGNLSRSITKKHPKAKIVEINNYCFIQYAGKT